MPGQTRRTSPLLFHATLAGSLAVAATALLWLALSRRWGWEPWLGCWLVCLNVISFGYYGVDKARARGAVSRVPESVLHGLSAAGGSLGSYLAMRLFRHKTVKGPFRVLFWCIVLLQVLLGLWLVKSVWWV